MKWLEELKRKRNAGFNLILQSPHETWFSGHMNTEFDRLIEIAERALEILRKIEEEEYFIPYKLKVRLNALEKLYSDEYQNNPPDSEE